MLPLIEKAAAAAAPPARLSLCSQTLSERAGHFVLVAKEDAARQRQHESAQACIGGALAVVVRCGGDARLHVAGTTVACEGVLRTQGRLYRFTYPMDPTEVRGGIAVRLK